VIPVLYEPEAVEELEEAAAWYERARPGLGHRFAADVEEAVDRIEEAPLSFASVVRFGADLVVRRALLHQFPYSIVFLPLAADLRVLAIAHLHRRPGYWRGRVPL
jgi:hypothetical protein